MNTKPILTYAGAGPLFRSLESHLAQAIPLDTCEWRRSFGRPVKSVRLEAVFQPFSTGPLDKYKKGEWSIQEHPVLHIFVTECNDVDTYKSTVKEEIDQWLKLLLSYDTQDWMILLVETLDVRKTKNLLPRTTVLDKIRLDFASKHGDRCISVLNPAKFEQKSTESFRCLVQRIRHLMLTSYNKNISKYEELIRTNREKRNQDGWNFTRYFLLQEDLALILEKLDLHTEALIQYDELDAMFSQFVTNSVFGERHKWLEAFTKPLSSFHGIALNRRNKFENRKTIISEEATLIEFRNYLFERQTHLLQLSEKTSEIAERLLPFLFSTLREIDILKLEAPVGALACWEFVCSLEVLAVCDQAMETNEVACFQNCAPIWNLAKDKLYELGKICGLLPGFTPTSEQLHIVVQLSAGIGDAPGENTFIDPLPQIEKKSHSPNRKPKKSSTEQLKEALGANQTFTKLYLELSELAISTYKHVSRLRSARLVGLDLGNFYCALNEPHKAVVFFTDLLRELKSENWNCLTSQTLLELASCYRKMDDTLAYTKTCSAISCCLELEILVRTFYFDEFLKSFKSLNQTLAVEETCNSNFAVLEDHFKITDIVLVNEKPIIQDDVIVVQLKLESHFPREIFVDKISVSFEMQSASNETISPSVLNASNAAVNARQNVSLHLDYKQDNTLASASVACDMTRAKQPVRRTSSTRRKLSPTARSNFTNNVFIESRTIQPGANVVELKAKATRVGIWNFKQVLIQVKQIEFLSDRIPLKLLPFEITTKPASAVLSFKNLIAGIEQPVRLIVSGGSFIFPPEAKINLKCSKNLRVRLTNSEEEKFESFLSVHLTNFKSFEERQMPLEVLTDLPGRNVERHIEHKITLTCPWSRTELHIPLHFMPALTASCRLHTCGTQKFLQVCLKGLDAHLYLVGAKMKCDAKGVSLIDLNPQSQNRTEIYKNLTVSYLWELQVEPLKTENEFPVIKVNFSTQYASYDKQDILRNYLCAFDVMDYTTLFKIQARLEPSELCRVGSTCSLNLRITKVQENPFIDLMYEVLADQNMWAVCGRSAGVVSMKDVESHTISLEVLPLSAGFLPMPNIRLSKYISIVKTKQETHPKLQPFPPGQIYNSTKSMQIHVLAGANAEQ